MAGRLSLIFLLLAFVSPAVSQTPLILAERIQAQEKIERVYYNHRIWPEFNKSPKPPFEEMVPYNVIEQKVKKSTSASIPAEMLQAELDRIAKTTQDPGMLRELFETLNNDPYLIAETLVRPIVATKVKNFAPLETSSTKFSFRLPDINTGSSSCGGWDVLDAIDPPSPRSKHTAIWTGTEMIIWGGSGLNTGGRYDPALNTWTPTSMDVNVPSGRYLHTAVWTGSEMIIWGGITNDGLTNTGGRYNLGTDTWLPTSVGLDVPQPRSRHTAIWTGSEMIIWGGGKLEEFELNTGGRYDPSTDSWQPTSLGTNVPFPRQRHTAIWTGQEMIIWGGSFDPGSLPLDTGGRYNPLSDSWQPTSLVNVPAARKEHVAVWTGSQMIIWGGGDGPGPGVTNTGGIYDPAADEWQATSLVGAPFEIWDHSAVWTGTEMIIWGGDSPDIAVGGKTATGGRYSPATDTWLSTAIGPNAPSRRSNHTAVWTGTKMIIFGGSYVGPINPGGIYSPESDNIVVNPVILQNPEINVFYSQTISASGGTPPYTIELVEGWLPDDLTLDSSSGVISGIPEYLDGYGFNLAFTAIDANSCPGSRGYFIYVCPEMIFSPPSLPDAKVGVAYIQLINVDSLGHTSFSITAGVLPDGLILDELTGVISGIPTTVGTFNFTITVIGTITVYGFGGAECTKSHDYAIKVTDCLSVSPTTLPDGQVDVNYNQTISASGGTEPYTFSISSGALPAGLTLDAATGVISGTPTTVELASFTITVTDAQQCLLNQPYTINIVAALCLLCDDFEDGVLDPNWTVVKPAWNESGGSLNGTPDKKKAIIVATSAFAGCQTCFVESAIVTAGGVANKIWMLGWYQDKQNAMELLFKEENDKIVLKQRANGGIVAKNKGSITLNPNTSYQVRVAFDGTIFTVYVDGTQLFTLTPAAPVPSGTVGFQVKGTTGSFGYITVN